MQQPEKKDYRQVGDFAGNACVGLLSCKSLKANVSKMSPMRYLFGKWRTLALGIVLIGMLLSALSLPNISRWNNLAAIERLPASIVRSDAENIKPLGGWLQLLLPEIARAEPGTNFYFLPTFREGEATSPNWWMACVAIRYLAYPKLIYSHEPGLYDNSVEKYKTMFVGDKINYTDLAWIKKHKIKYVIIVNFDNAKIIFQETGTPIVL